MIKEKEQTETQPVFAETQISKFSIWFKTFQTFLCFSLIKSIALFLQLNNFIGLPEFANPYSWLSFFMLYLLDEYKSFT